VNLTPEQQAIGRRNFLKAVAGVPALAGLGAAAAWKGPVRGGPVRLGLIGVGGEGRVLLDQVDPAHGDVRALCDINPTQLAKADDVLSKKKRPAARHYAEWREMLQHEDLEAVLIAVPLWAHADVTSGCLEAGKHVLCEKMMAYDVASCERMARAADANRRVLAIGYQRYANPIYHAAYAGVIQAGMLGDVHYARLAWHRNGNWRRRSDPPSPGYDPSKWGYPTFEHLLNWRLYKRYSRGLLAELASHQVSIVNWFFDATPHAVYGTGGIHRFKDGREVDDHVYVTFEYPNGRTATFSSIESNAYDHYYEAFYGTKGTLILRGEAEAYLFSEGSADAHATTIEVAPKAGGPALEASESRTADAAGSASKSTTDTTDRLVSYRNEISSFCSAIRLGTPVACGPEPASHSALACIRAFEAVEHKARLPVAPTPSSATRVKDPTGTPLASSNVAVRATT
jgi:predicted dehydrogenase